MMVEGCLDTRVALATAMMICSRTVSDESEVDTETDTPSDWGYLWEVLSHHFLVGSELEF